MFDLQTVIDKLVENHYKHPGEINSEALHRLILAGAITRKEITLIRGVGESGYEFLLRHLRLEEKIVSMK